MDPIYILFGLGVGVLVGLTGIGGGSLMTPLLILVGGVSPSVAIGTDLAYGAITKTVGGWRHLRLGTVDLGISKWMAFGSVPGSVAGVALSTAIDVEALLAIVAVALSVAALAILGRSLVRTPKEQDSVVLDTPHRVGAVATGLILGTLVGMTSVGSGALIGPILILLFRLTPRRVVGTDVFHAAILLWTAGIAHGIVGNVDYGLVATILIGSIPGSGSAPGSSAGSPPPACARCWAACSSRPPWGSPRRPASSSRPSGSSARRWSSARCSTSCTAPRLPRTPEVLTA